MKATGPPAATIFALGARFIVNDASFFKILIHELNGVANEAITHEPKIVTGSADDKHPAAEVPEEDDDKFPAQADIGPAASSATAAPVDTGPAAPSADFNAKGRHEPPDEKNGAPTAVAAQVDTRPAAPSAELDAKGPLEPPRNEDARARMQDNKRVLTFEALLDRQCAFIDGRLGSVTSRCSALEQCMAAADEAKLQYIPEAGTSESKQNRAKSGKIQKKKAAYGEG